MRHECGCPDGTVQREASCEDQNECLNDPCQNGGTCHNEVPLYNCKCLHGYFGRNCENGRPNTDPPVSTVPPVIDSTTQADQETTLNDVTQTPVQKTSIACE